MEKDQLKNIHEIFSETWTLYKSNVIPTGLASLVSLLVSIMLLIGGGTAAFLPWEANLILRVIFRESCSIRQLLAQEFFFFSLSFCW
ncbi:MAG: hypothetical protein D3925_08410 [Candidatus Electrothrix sp. AR5]|nr:hypothetical protein [Candidatus Electrothrix sp. AR5]